MKEVEGRAEGLKEVDSKEGAKSDEKHCCLGDTNSGKRISCHTDSKAGIRLCAVLSGIPHSFMVQRH